jgi:hypothetical protein
MGGCSGFVPQAPVMERDKPSLMEKKKTTGMKAWALELELVEHWN